MKLYFDSNIFRYITEVKEGEAVRHFLDDNNHRVMASSSNLLEVYAIPKRWQRIAELETLVSVASSYEKAPTSWHDAMELRSEITRCRPEWLQHAPQTKELRRFLRGQRQMWNEAVSLNIPSDGDYAPYRRDSERAIGEYRQNQRIMKRVQSLGANDWRLSRDPENPNNHTPVDMANPEVFWRVDGAQIWYRALAGKDPALRDYVDWLGPYLKEKAFEAPTYLNFWLEEVSAERLPYNRLAGLISHYQIGQKVTRGNAEDQNHARHLLDVDLFFTADRAFHAVLMTIANQYLKACAKPVLLDRAASSIVSQLQSNLPQDEVNLGE